MNIDGFLVVRSDDNAYQVRDANRNLGSVVRYWIPATDGKGMVKRFRAFGQDFSDLREAVSEFALIQGVRPMPAETL